MYCMTEEQKGFIVDHGNMMVVEFKRMFDTLLKALKWLAEKLRCYLDGLGELYRCYRNSSPKERYKTVRRLEKCGFDEKDINLMVFRAYHCRNNC